MTDATVQYQLFPPLSADEYASLKADIRERHHLTHRKDGSPTIDENLETRCHVCHKDEHETQGQPW